MNIKVSHLLYRGHDLVVICNYVDANWSNIFGSGGLKGVFQIKLVFDDVGKQVSYQENQPVLNGEFDQTYCF